MISLIWYVHVPYYVFSLIDGGTVQPVSTTVASSWTPQQVVLRFRHIQPGVVTRRDGWMRSCTENPSTDGLTFTDTMLIL